MFAKPSDEERASRVLPAHRRRARIITGHDVPFHLREIRAHPAPGRSISTRGPRRADYGQRILVSGGARRELAEDSCRNPYAYAEGGDIFGGFLAGREAEQESWVTLDQQVFPMTF